MPEKSGCAVCPDAGAAATAANAAVNNRYRLTLIATLTPFARTQCYTKLVIPGERCASIAREGDPGARKELVLQDWINDLRPMREHLYFVYILASRRNGTLYIGVTNDVMRRTWEHKNEIAEGFTKKYGVHILVWYEAFSDINAAIAREKQLKGWNRAWKIKLIEKTNSGWNDLYQRLLGEIGLPDLPGSPSLASLRSARRG